MRTVPSFRAPLDTVTLPFCCPPTAVLSTEIISTVVNQLFGGESLQTYDEALRIELLKLATLLIEHVADQARRLN